MDATPLTGKHVRLEPLEMRHLDGLAAAAAEDGSLYRWSAVPQGRAEVEAYIETALAWREAGKALPFAIVRASDGVVIGSTRFFDLERWAWPRAHARCGRSEPDVCEIGYSWLSRSAIRTAANTESKLLTLSYAFERWQVLRVCLHTDVRNGALAPQLNGSGESLRGFCAHTAWPPTAPFATRRAIRSSGRSGRS